MIAATTRRTSLRQATAPSVFLARRANVSSETAATSRRSGHSTSPMPIASRLGFHKIGEAWSQQPQEQLLGRRTLHSSAAVRADIKRPEERPGSHSHNDGSSTPTPIVVALTATITLALSFLYQSVAHKANNDALIAHAESSSSLSPKGATGALSAKQDSSKKSSSSQLSTASTGDAAEEPPTAGYGDASLGISQDVLEAEQVKASSSSAGAGPGRYADAKTRRQAIDRLKELLGQEKVSVVEEDRVGHGMAGEWLGKPYQERRNGGS